MKAKLRQACFSCAQALVCLSVVVMGIVMGTPANGQALQDVAPLPPYKFVRSLQYVQDSVVLGDHSAGEVQRHLLKIVDSSLREADKQIFEDERNVDAALIYAMSGGNPQTLAHLVERDEDGHFDRRLTDALTIYFSGAPEKAQPMLLKLLPEYSQTRIGAYMILVAANVTATRNEIEALNLFDRARLVAPGTIIEESSLRRATHIASRVGDIDRSLDNAERYVRRFIHSPYASQFVDIFVHAIVLHSDAADRQRIDYILSLMDLPRQREIYLRMARMSTIAGKEEIALLAASRAEALSGEKRDVVRDLAGFYAGIAKVPTSNITEAIEAMTSIPDHKLSERDLALREAAKTIAKQVTAPPDLTSLEELMVPAIAPAGDPAVRADAETEQGEEDPEASMHGSFMASKREKLMNIDTLLNEESNE
ncbi:chemotaxis protein [Hoeflea prorocentri]|uniref:Chemotaxis protein n=1 Tax=Hoeflea prorocentri TaxID=1922333 RepID=A0A9X3UNC0_9HYPH|nr:chemotaxis protein [Hoeflea prorocentri]MCY6382384.1 chemotaxis protein [Hoeflea prorocentri]MDA5400184.1 chemotaxis protein [Hoeflea prorocentri]